MEIEVPAAEVASSVPSSLPWPETHKRVAAVPDPGVHQVILHPFKLRAFQG